MQLAKFPNNMYIYWNSLKHVEIVLPVAYMHHTCGICGDFNGSDLNDKNMGDHVTGAGRGCEPLEAEGPPLTQVQLGQVFVQ